MERKLFDKQMRRLAGLKFAPATMDTHWEGLADLTDDELDGAIGIAVRTCNEFPSPAELRSLRPRVRRCQYDHEPPCDSSSECVRRFLDEQRGGLRAVR